jgi:hypothetical protein
LGGIRITGPVLAGITIALLFLAVAMKPGTHGEAASILPLRITSSEIGGKGPSVFTARIDREIRDGREYGADGKGLEEKVTHVTHDLQRILNIGGKQP